MEKIEEQDILIEELTFQLNSGLADGCSTREDSSVFPK